MKKVAFFAVVALCAFVTTAAAQQNSAVNLLDSPVKVEREIASVGETVSCTMPLPGSLFGVDEIVATSPTEFIGDELFGSLFSYRVNENCVLLASWINGWPVAPLTQTGITHDHIVINNYWVVDPFTGGQIAQFNIGTGVPTGATVGLAAGFPGTWGPLALDSNQAGKLAYCEDIAADVALEYDLSTGAVGCSFPNPDNSTGSGAFGNGISEAADPGACSGATLTISSGTITEGQVTRASQTDCSGTLCYFTWDIATPTLPFGETFANGIEEFVSATGADKRLFVFGNATGTVFNIGRPVGITDCQGIDSPDSDVVYVNSSLGGASFTVGVDNTAPLGYAVQNPPAGGNGKYVMHMNSGVPSAGTIATLPASLGSACFDVLIAPFGSGAPVSVWNNIGKSDKVGGSNYFGTPTADPAKAPAYFEARAAGDTGNMSVGSQWTMQGVIINLGATSPKSASVTNGVIIDVTSGV